MTLDFILWLVLCSREDVSFNMICLNVLKGNKQLYLLMWFKKFRLETLFKCGNVKSINKNVKLRKFDPLSLEESSANLQYQ